MADVERRRAAAVPEETEFATKPELARRMIERALQAGTPCNWVAADEVYYYCVTRIRAGSIGTVAEIGRGGLRSDGAGWQWIEDYAVLSLRVAPRGV